MTAEKLEQRLKYNPNKFVLKPYESAKAVVWNQFYLIFEKNESDIAQTEPALVEQKYFCACTVCRKVYAYKSADGATYFGTKNLINHLQTCHVKTPKQLEIRNCLRVKSHLAAADAELLKRREVEFCANGYHSFRSVEHVGFQNLLQTCVDFGAKYGKIDIKDALVKRNTVSRSIATQAENVKKKIFDFIQEPIKDGSVSLCLDLYTDDYRKKAYLDVHATWVNRDFTMQHGALAVRHFGTEAHTGENISAAVNAIFLEYNLSAEDTPVTTDKGSNVVAALKNNVRVDCMCHRLHTVLSSAWKDTMAEEPDAALYETNISSLCRYVKQATGIQVNNVIFLLFN